MHRSGGLLSVAHIRYGGTRKVDRVTHTIGYHLDYIRIGDLTRVFDPLFQGAHNHTGVIHEGEDGSVDGGGVDERFVTLNIDDRFGGFGRSDFGHTVRARQVVGTSHAHAGAK